MECTDRQPYDIIRDILTVIEELNTLKDVDAILDRVLGEARAMTNADAGSIFLVEGDQLRFSYVHNDTLFHGADYTMAVDAIMPNGKTLQIGTVHHLGEHFSKTFSITFEDKNGEQKFASQTCYGISERCIAALISMHGDDKGLILPPISAPVQAVIVPITIGKRHEDVLTAAEKLKTDLTTAGFRVKIDTRDMRPGAKYYWWELRGVPLRLELGPRDLDAGKVMAVKRTGEKTQIELATVTDEVTRVLGEITETIRARAEEHTRTHLCTVASMDALDAALNEGKVAVVSWCQQKVCGDVIEEKTNASILGTNARSQYVSETEGACIVCGKTGKATLVGRTY